MYNLCRVTTLLIFPDWLFVTPQIFLYLTLNHLLFQVLQTSDHSVYSHVNRRHSFVVLQYKTNYIKWYINNCHHVTTDYYNKGCTFPNDSVPDIMEEKEIQDRNWLTTFMWKWLSKWRQVSVSLSSRRSASQVGWVIQRLQENVQSLLTCSIWRPQVHQCGQQTVSKQRLVMTICD